MASISFDPNASTPPKHNRCPICRDYYLPTPGDPHTCSRDNQVQGCLEQLTRIADALEKLAKIKEARDE
jgi:hypothetical protein